MKTRLWPQVLLITGGLYVISLVILAITENPNLFPTVVLLGSFAVPVAFVSFFYDNKVFSNLTIEDVGLSFLYGGALSLLLAGITEPVFIRSLTLGNFLLAGLIEELAKILAVVAVTRRRKHVSELNGIIFGAAVGMGFAALESAGYSFTAFFQSGGSLSLTVLLTLFRALISPFGHGVWTAILAGILFRESAPHRFRFDLNFILAFISISFLHGLWNSLPLLLGMMSAPGLLIFLAQVVLAVLGLLILYYLWEDAKKRQVSR